MKTTTMDWKVIIILSTIGLIMGLLSVKGFTQKLEPLLWLLFSIASALVLAKNIDHRTLLHGLLIGLAWGILNGLSQSVFFDTYLANNPALRDSFGKTALVNPRYMALVSGPAVGLITGLVLGGMALLLRRIW